VRDFVAERNWWYVKLKTNPAIAGIVIVEADTGPEDKSTIEL